MLCWERHGTKTPTLGGRVTDRRSVSVRIEGRSYGARLENIAVLPGVAAAAQGLLNTRTASGKLACGSFVVTALAAR